MSFASHKTADRQKTLDRLREAARPVKKPRHVAEKIVRRSDKLVPFDYATFGKADFYTLPQIKAEVDVTAKMLRIVAYCIRHRKHIPHFQEVEDLIFEHDLCNDPSVGKWDLEGEILDEMIKTWNTVNEHVVKLAKDVLNSSKAEDDVAVNYPILFLRLAWLDMEMGLEHRPKRPWIEFAEAIPDRTYKDGTRKGKDGRSVPKILTFTTKEMAVVLHIIDHMGQCSYEFANQTMRKIFGARFNKKTQRPVKTYFSTAKFQGIINRLQETGVIEVIEQGGVTNKVATRYGFSATRTIS